MALRRAQEQDGAGLVGSSDHHPARLRRERDQIDAFLRERRPRRIVVSQKRLIDEHAFDWDPRFEDFDAGALETSPRSALPRSTQPRDLRVCSATVGPTEVQK